MGEVPRFLGIRIVFLPRDPGFDATRRGTRLAMGVSDDGSGAARSFPSPYRGQCFLRGRGFKITGSSVIMWYVILRAVAFVARPTQHLVRFQESTTCPATPRCFGKAPSFSAQVLRGDYYQKFSKILRPLPLIGSRSVCLSFWQWYSPIHDSPQKRGVQDLLLVCTITPGSTKVSQL